MITDNKQVSIERTGVEDGKLVVFGPLDPSNGVQLSIPERFEREVTSGPRGLTLRVSCSFTGEWIDVSSLSVTPPKGEGLTSRALVQIALPPIVRELAASVIPRHEYWTAEFQDALGWGSLKTNDAFLAQLYWLEHVSQGSPRQTLMRYLAMPRSTCNVLIRRLRSEFPLPRPRTEPKSA